MNVSLIPTAAFTLHNVAPIFLMLALGICLCLVCVLSKPIFDECIQRRERERLFDRGAISRQELVLARAGARSHD